MSGAKKAESERRKHPRYNLKASDISNARFKNLLSGLSSKIAHTEIINVSESGLAFRTPASEAPRLGSIIAVEFQIPGSEQIACKARVMRIEKLGLSAHGEMLRVGVQFIMLPDAFRKILSEKVAERVDIETPDAREDWNFRASFSEGVWLSALKWVLIFAVLITGLLYFVLYMQRLAETKWWLKEAEVFFQESREAAPQNSKEN